jgi:hypothetical protein
MKISLFMIQRNMKITAWIQRKKISFYRYTLAKRFNRYYRRHFYAASVRYSIPSIPQPRNYVDGYTIFQNTLPALLTMSAMNFFRFGNTVDAKKLASEMWYCRKLIKKASAVDTESTDRTDVALKAKFGKNTGYDFTFKKVPDSKYETMKTIWSGYDNPLNVSKEKIEKQIADTYSELVHESAEWEMKETNARWKAVFDYITEPVTDHVSKKEDPQFGPYDRTTCMRFLRWWD